MKVCCTDLLNEIKVLFLPMKYPSALSYCFDLSQLERQQRLCQNQKNISTGSQKSDVPKAHKPPVPVERSTSWERWPKLYKNSFFFTKTQPALGSAEYWGKEIKLHLVSIQVMKVTFSVWLVLFWIKKKKIKVPKRRLIQGRQKTNYF